MRLAKDTRQTLDLAIEALIELLDAIGPDPDAEPSLGATTSFDQEYAWVLGAGYLDDREEEHDGREWSEDEPHFYDESQHPCCPRAGERGIKSAVEAAQDLQDSTASSTACERLLTAKVNEDSLGSGEAADPIAVKNTVSL